ncbi:mechanosensitive ion channel family protein [Haloferax mediterranei ATCC 33500]|uniref:Mechanosensitive ion channel n=1 Tax=Haloferax mediterranei (strain ATCC 33500 / DSM 1411 / JCM 8866 / NBRC 14739 / NCIMB 2177 / R-4) TaxID=523841 RepID=I3R3T0_HALMT|nr:mechanosensitive ion channel family protein [Haloferax mediterranei]AFK18890.1 putative mechanosensitive ion channel [Haloferax mediterranei ATCC 33500]AHZ21745.1 mechanosensitive ion channel protein [Haloferax mediterranei ATCC 33500]EMA03251.1 putative mechanosensitive ion channel [Haloferax mediterranei ATCC 33500]MDX5988984.1 mechanosensitive ion channel family protein [Haloferax mediterranei ATCC 33500]QCQ75377.1 mechanosensitive ion channel family protein [Haloferax mediterranei ATCC 
MNLLALPLQLQGDGGAVGQFLAQQNIPYAATFGAILGFIIGFAVVYVVGKAVLSSVVSRMLDRRGADKHAKQPLLKIVTLVTAFIALAVGFGFAGLGNFLQSLATIGAAATLAIGFAMQDVIANFVAGIFIFTDRPFRIGDWVEWDGNSGIVEDISFRVTRVRTFDNELLTVPNSQLTSGVIKNPVAKDKLRLQVPFGIGYDDDIENATDIILEEADKHEGIMTDPEPSVRLTELGNSAVVLKSRIWISNPSRADFVKTRGEYVTAVKARFDDEGIDFPYPNRTLSGELSVEGIEQLARSND